MLPQGVLKAHAHVDAHAHTERTREKRERERVVDVLTSANEVYRATITITIALDPKSHYENSRRKKKNGEVFSLSKSELSGGNPVSVLCVCVCQAATPEKLELRKKDKEVLLAQCLRVVVVVGQCFSNDDDDDALTWCSDFCNEIVMSDGSSDDELEEYADSGEQDSTDGDGGIYIEEAFAEVNRLRSIATGLSSLFEVAESSLSIQETLARRMRSNLSFPSQGRDANATDNAFTPRLRPNIFAARKTLQTLLSSLNRSSTRLDAILASGQSCCDTLQRSMECRLHAQKERVEHDFAVLVDGLDELQQGCDRLEAAHEAGEQASAAAGGGGREKHTDGEDAWNQGQAIGREGAVAQVEENDSQRRKLDAVIMEVQSEMLELLLTSAAGDFDEPRSAQTAATMTNQHNNTSDEMPNQSSERQDDVMISIGDNEDARHQKSVSTLGLEAGFPKSKSTSSRSHNEGVDAGTQDVANTDRAAALDLLEKKIEEKAVLQAITLRNERNLIGSRYFDSLTGLIVRQRKELNRVLRESERREHYLESRIASLQHELQRKYALTNDESENTEKRLLGAHLKAFEAQLFR